MAKKVFLSQRTNRHVVKRLDAAYAVDASFGVWQTAKTDNTGLNFPRNVARDTSNNVYVCDCNNKRIVKLTSALTFVSALDITNQIDQPYSIFFDTVTSNLFVAGVYKHRFLSFAQITTSMAVVKYDQQIYDIDSNDIPLGVSRGFTASDFIVSGCKDLLRFTDPPTFSVNSTNNKLDFTEVFGTQIAATISTGIYTSSSLCVEVKTQLDTVGQSAYTVSYGSNKFTISSNGSRDIFAGVNNMLDFKESGVNDNTVIPWIQVAGLLGIQVQIRCFCVLNGSLYAGTYGGARLFKWDGISAWIQVAGTLLSQNYIFSLSVMNGKIYGTTGRDGVNPGGYLFEWNGVNAWVQVAPQFGSEIKIESSCVLNNELYAVTSTSGLLLKWNGVNAWVQVAGTLNGQTDLRTCIVFNGKIYSGTSPTGRLFEWNGVNAWVQVAPQFGSVSTIRSLCVLNNELYAGTSSGTLLKWNGVNAWTQVAAQLSGQTQIYSLVVFQGEIYGCTALNGLLFKWNGLNAWIQVTSQTLGQTTIIPLIVFNNKIYGGTYAPSSPNGLLFEYTPRSTGIQQTIALTPGTYLPAALATHIQTELNRIGTANYTVTFTGANKFQIVSDGSAGIFNILWNTGRNSVASVGPTIGFDISSDSGGSLTHIADRTMFELNWNTGSNKSTSIGTLIGYDLTSDDINAFSYISDFESAFGSAYPWEVTGEATVSFGGTNRFLGHVKHTNGYIYANVNRGEESKLSRITNGALVTDPFINTGDSNKISKLSMHVAESGFDNTLLVVNQDNPVKVERYDTNLNFIEIIFEDLGDLISNDAYDISGINEANV